MFGMLAGCGDKDDVKASKDKTEQTSGDANGNEIKDSKDSNKDDQLDLHIGDTGTIKTEYQGTFEVTLNSIEMPDKIGDEKSADEAFVIAKVTVKNIGKTEIEANEIAGLVDLFDLLEEESSVSDYAALAPGIDNPLSKQGTIAQGKSVNGVLVFDTFKSDKYQLIFGYASEGIMNKVVWTFTPKEAK